VSDDTRRLVAPQSHEFDAHLNYNRDGLRPYFGLARAVSEGGGSVETTFTDDSDTWEVTLRYTEGNLVPPENGVTPGGSEWNVSSTEGNVREFRRDVSAASDELQSASFHVRPRWRGLEGEKSNGTVVSIPVPDSLVADGDALSVRAQGSNLPFDAYPRLLRRAARAVGVTGYLRPDDLHRTSNVTDAARYLRIDKAESGPIHAHAGTIPSLAHVLTGDREGYRRLVQNDETDHGENLPGYYHTATLGQNRVREVFPDHELPVEVKHYSARDALDRSDDDPLAHPKLEVSLQSSRWDGTLRYDDLDQLHDELDSWLYSVVQDALGESALRAGYGGYVSDDVWTLENVTTSAAPVELNLTEVRHEQERVVYKHFADGMPDSDRGILKTLVADGGRLSPAELADETARHRSTVYDALDRMDYLVDHGYGEVQLKSTYVAELVADAIEEAESAVGRAMDAAGKALATAERGLDETTSAFLAWQERYTDSFTDRDTDDGGVRLDLGQVESVREVRRLLREGLDLWEAMNRDPATYRMGTVKWRREGQSGVQHGTIWQLVRGTTTSGGTKVVRTRR
jgi:hypothetical protein